MAIFNPSVDGQTHFMWKGAKKKKIKIKKNKKTTRHAHTFGEHRNERYCLVQVLAKQMKQDLIVENLGHCIYLYLCPYIHQIDTLDAATCAQSE